MLKQYDDWLTEYIHYTSGHEIPKLYNKWVGLGLISSVLKQNVYLDMGTYNLYPNLFIVMVDEAGAGKSHAIERFGLGLLKYADEKDTSDDKIYIYNQRITAAAMMKSMSELYKSRGVHCVTVIAEELGFFTDMSGDNSNISNVLIKTFDNSDLSNETIARSLDSTPNAQLNIIGGTTPGSLKDSVNKKFIDAGVISRIIFIHSDEIGDPKPFPTPPKENNTRREYLADDLNDFKKLKGKFRWTQEAMDCYEDWYIQTMKNCTIRKDKLLVKRIAGKMLKIAMILSIARKHELILTEEDILNAIQIRNEALDNYQYIDSRLIMNDFGDKTQRILDEIKNRGKISHSDLQRKVHGWLDKDGLRKTIETLADSELIEIKQITSKGATKPTNFYVWKG